MSMRERVYRVADREMSWTTAILLGIFIWILLIIGTGQIPSYIIYWMDQNVASIIDFTKRIPGVNKEGLNPKQILIVRDVIANSVQMGFLTALLVVAYFWQKHNQKRRGEKGLQDPVKGYMSGK